MASHSINPSVSDAHTVHHITCMQLASVNCDIRDSGSFLLPLIFAAYLLIISCASSWQLCHNRHLIQAFTASQRNSVPTGTLDFIAVWPLYANHAMQYSELAYVPDDLSNLPHQIVSLISRFWDIFKPGGQFHPESFIENRGHLVLEGILIVVISYLFLQKSFNPKQQRQQQTELTEQVSTYLLTVRQCYTRTAYNFVLPFRKLTLFVLSGNLSLCLRLQRTISQIMTLLSFQGKHAGYSAHVKPSSLRSQLV